MEKQSLDDLIRRANSSSRLAEVERKREAELQRMREEREREKAERREMIKKYLREDEQDQ